MKTTSMDSVQKDQAIVSITEFMRYETDKKATRQACFTDTQMAYDTLDH